MVTQFVSKPPGLHNGGSDWWQHHCLIQRFSGGVAGTLGKWPEVRKYRVGMERVEKWHPPFLPFPPSSSQTDSQLGCELWGEEASLFLWVSLHPLRVNVYMQHGIGRLSY